MTSKRYYDDTHKASNVQTVLSVIITFSKQGLPFSASASLALAQSGRSLVSTF